MYSNNESINKALKEIKEKEANRKVPIKRGCPNRECYCTGKCQEIIGYRDKIVEEY